MRPAEQLVTWWAQKIVETNPPDEPLGYPIQKRIVALNVMLSQLQQLYGQTDVQTYTEIMAAVSYALAVAAQGLIEYGSFPQIDNEGNVAIDDEDAEPHQIDEERWRQPPQEQSRFPYTKDQPDAWGK